MVIQNDALRTIMGRRRRDSAADILVKFDLLPLDKLFQLHVATLAFKISKQVVPDDIAFAISAVGRKTTRRATEFVLPSAIRESSRHALAYRLPAIWASLPRDIRVIPTLKLFKRFVRKRLADNMLRTVTLRNDGPTAFSRFCNFALV
jgi:hypothetical protein